MVNDVFLFLYNFMNVVKVQCKEYHGVLRGNMEGGGGGLLAHYNTKSRRRTLEDCFTHLLADCQLIFW